MKDQPYDTIIQRIKLHLDPKKKVIPQRCRFLKRIQQEGESISEYLRELKHLAMNCNFGDMLGTMMRDRFVAGIKLESLQKKLLQENDDVTLDKVLQIKRWSLKLSAFNYTVEFRKTSDNSNVDAFSRLPLESSVRESLDEDQVLLLRKLNEASFSFMEVAYETPQDTILSIVLRNVIEGNWKFTRVPMENQLAPHYKINEELSLEFGCLQWREIVDWELHIDVQGYPSYDELIAFLEKYARSLANLRLRETSKTSPKPNKVYSHATSVSRPNSNAACTPCMLCQNSHLLSKYQLFRDKSLQERWRFVRDNGLCYNCLRSNHLVYACKLTAVCGVCKLRHHTLLHAFTSESHDSNSLPGAIHAVESSNANRVDSSVRSNVNYLARLNAVIQTHSINHSSSSSQILLSTALIRVNDLYGYSCMARALIDTGSQRTLITDSLRKTLNLPVNYSDASMYGIRDNCLEKPLGEMDITFSPHYSNMLFTAKALILNKITCNLPNFVMERSRWPHLVGLRLADPTFDKPAPIDIIIGSDIAPSLYTGQVRFKNEKCPTACNSKLGWLLSGKIMAQQSDGSLHHSVLTFCATSIDNQLRRFRTFFVALSADIEKMYRQILIHTDDSNYQRVLWRDSPSDAIQEYKLTTITYGTACAPYLAIRTLHQLADDEAMNYPVASEIVKRDIYVDDLLTGAYTVEEAQVLIRQIIALLAEGGFPIRKWVSNSPKIVDFVPKDQKGINQSFDFMDLPSVKLLSILWDPSLDSFTIRVKPPDIQVYSKRSLLSLIARIYDPLGWMAPLVIIFKIMLQKLWAKGCNWDERLPECIQWQWTGIEEDINQLNKISIPRYIPCRNSILTLELHGFCDSSEKAYAAVIYVESCKHDGSFNISLIASKTKVAPIKVLSLPRLELCSALLLANLFVAVKESLSLHFDQIFLWSDSTIALNWIKSESKRWKTFVANRVSDIQRKTPSHSWFHVPGSENPADLATRGLTPAQLVDNQLWWQGPHWLQDPSVNSYMDLPPSDELSPETLIEERSTILLYHSIVGTMPELLLKYSSWIKTVDIMAYCLRFISNCKSTNKSLKRFLSSSEIHNATVKILIQNQEFTQDIGWLRDKGFVSGKSNFRFLNPFLDADGILRVGGRLQHSNLDYNQKHPIILPKRHHCTDLIIEHYHKQSLHSGLQTTLSMVSQKYWIISCKAAVKRVLNQCITCFKHRSKVLTQIMGELPLERVVPSRPFQRVGVDLAGPIITKPVLKRSKILFKTYIVLFICFSTKAIHLEVVSDLTAEAFIATLRRFTSRRGLPSDIFSDNATNFKLANRVLLDFYRELDIQISVLKEGLGGILFLPLLPILVDFGRQLIMSLRKILADDLKWRAIGRMEAGQSQVEVAKWLNLNKSVVSKIWKQFIETGTIKRKEGSGRKRKTATSEDRYLVVTAKRHREMTAIQLSNELSSATGTRISRQTVYRRLHEGVLYARRPMV
ncbi:hypothetical protein LAZ67_13000765, partial [Cordylochernes scorpioides]